MFYRTMTAMCLLATQAQADVPNVATDIAPVHSLVARVMQGVGEPDMIIRQGASPHGYALRPSEARALQNADLVVWVGDDLTPWLEEAIDSLAADAHALELLHAEGTQVFDFRESAVFGDHDDHEEHDDHHDRHKDEHGHDDDHDEHHDEHEDEHKDEHAGHDDHGHEDHHDHGGADPHAWMSPANAAVWLKAIAEELSELDPANADIYTTNAEVGATEIAAAVDDIKAQLAPVKDAGFVVFHDAYQYFEEAFGLHVTGAIQISDATAPSAARIAELQAEIAEHSIFCIFAEPQFNDDLVAAVAPEGTKTGIIDPLATNIPAGPSLYTRWLRGLANNVSDCLG